MAVSQLFEGYQQAIRAFLDDEACACLFVTAIPEAHTMAAKLIASVEQEAERDEVMFAYSGPFLDAQRYFEAAARHALGDFEAQRASLRGHHVECALPEGLLASDVSWEGRFAEFAECAARALALHVAPRTVFVFHNDRPEHEAAFMASMRGLASWTDGRRAKFIVLTEQAADVRVPAPQRLRVLGDARRREREAELEAFLASPSRRVQVLRTDGCGPERALRDVGTATVRSHLNAQLVRIVLRPDLLDVMADDACAQLRAQAERGGLPLAAHDATLRGADAFAHLCETLAHQHVEARGSLVVAIELGDWADTAPELARAWVARLSMAACAVRVRYILFDGTPSGLGLCMAAPTRDLRALHVRLDASAIEAGLCAHLQVPGLEEAERIRCLHSLAALSSAHHEHERALRYSDQALGLARVLEEPLVAITTWLSVAQALYAARAWFASTEASRRALALALDADAANQAAQATLLLADGLLCAEQFEAASRCYEAAIAWYDRLGLPLFSAHAATWLGEAQRRRGDAASALQVWCETLERYARLDEQHAPGVADGKKQVLARLVALERARRERVQARVRERELDALGARPLLAERP